MAKFICHSLKNKLRKALFFKHHVLVSSENCNSFNKFQKLEKFYYFYKTNYEKKFPLYQYQYFYVGIQHGSLS